MCQFDHLLCQYYKAIATINTIINVITATMSRDDVIIMTCLTPHCSRSRLQVFPWTRLMIDRSFDTFVWHVDTIRDRIDNQCDDMTDRSDNKGPFIIIGHHNTDDGPSEIVF
jgi:hypothetical protein